MVNVPKSGISRALGLAAVVVIIVAVAGATYFRSQNVAPTTTPTTRSIASTSTSIASTTTASASTTQVPQRDYNGSLEVGGLTRSYLVHLPSSYDGKRATPLLLMFHALNNYDYYIMQHDLNNISEKRGFIVVYPNGYNASWAAGGAFPADVKGVDDVAFVSTLIDKMARELNIDTSKVYATGFSNGGMFSLRLACELSDKVAGVAAVGATIAEKVSATCSPKKLIPILIIHGTADNTVPLAGIAGFLSFPDTIGKWVGINGCPTSPVVTYAPHRDLNGGKVREEVYSPCRDNAKVAFYSVEGLHHEWPVAKFNDISSEGIWDFFHGAV